MKIDKEYLSSRLLHRDNVSHKGDYGHLCLVCGCDSMPGAAALATAAALKSGCGLVTLHTSASAASVSAVMNPSAILSIDSKPYFSDCAKDWGNYNAVAAGPGLGRQPESACALERLLASQHAAGRPMVLDADALNLIAADKRLLALIPPMSVLTPHDGELARLISWGDAAGNAAKSDAAESVAKGDAAGNAAKSAAAAKRDAADKATKTQELADSLNCVVVSKGYHTKVYVAGERDAYENTTGNPGMAKGGSGDVLTGLIGGLLARGYDSRIAAMMGVWIHGFAGDCCSEKFGMEAYSSRDLLDFLYLGFKALEQ